MAGSGLPADTGSTPVADWTAATREPFPTARPLSIGKEVSRFEAKNLAPWRMAKAPSVKCSQPTERSKPCTTAAGLSSALETTLKPMSRAKSRRESAPMISSFAPAGTSSAASWSTACAEVTICSVPAVRPMSASIFATACGLREALLVTYTAGTPQVLMTSTTLESGRPPSHTVPSRSRRRASCLLRTVTTCTPQGARQHRSSRLHQ